MDQTRLDAIRARCEAATPGKWKHDKQAVYVHVPGLGYMKIASGLEAEDAAFIAHARADVPDMLAEIERLTAALNLLESDRDAERKIRLGAEADRDAWRRRAEAAEADLGATACCRTCRSWHKNGGQCAPINPKAPMDCIVNEDNPHEWEWRGPEEDKQ